MNRTLFRRCATAPGPLPAEDQVAVDAFRATFTAPRRPSP